MKTGASNKQRVNRPFQIANFNDGDGETRVRRSSLVCSELVLGDGDMEKINKSVVLPLVKKQLSNRCHMNQAERRFACEGSVPLGS